MIACRIVSIILAGLLLLRADIASSQVGFADISGGCASPNEDVWVDFYVLGEVGSSITYAQVTVEWHSTHLPLQEIKLGADARASGWTLETNLVLPFGAACGDCGFGHPCTNNATASVAGIQGIGLDPEIPAKVISFRVRKGSTHTEVLRIACQGFYQGLCPTFVRIDEQDYLHDLCQDGCDNPCVLWGVGGVILDSNDPGCGGLKPFTSTWTVIKAIYR